ncbi:MAG: alpha/beta hydrolase [Pseudomonadota bacterium]
MTSFPDPEFIDAGGVRLAIYEINGDPEGARPPVILVHGWPEIAYSWKNVMPALAEAGWRVIAPDLKGFGRSDAPGDKSLYDIAHLTSDLAALIDALKIDRAVFCGHDWGGAIVWPMAQLHPDRVAGVIGVCTPHKPPPPVPPLAIMEKRFGARHYIVQFQEEETPERLFETDIERFFRIMFRPPASPEIMARLGNRIYDLPGRFRDGPPPDENDLIISKDDLAVFTEAYRRSGFHGGINLYRNIDRNYEIMKKVDPIIDAPALWVGAASDFFLPPVSAEGMEKFVSNLDKIVIDNCGHWVMWEQPEALNPILTDWLSRLQQSLS